MVLPLQATLGRTDATPGLDGSGKPDGRILASATVAGHACPPPVGSWRMLAQRERELSRDSAWSSRYSHQRQNQGNSAAYPSRVGPNPPRQEYSDRGPSQEALELSPFTAGFFPERLVVTATDVTRAVTRFQS